MHQSISIYLCLIHGSQIFFLNDKDNHILIIQREVKESSHTFDNILSIAAFYLLFDSMEGTNSIALKLVSSFSEKFSE